MSTYHGKANYLLIRAQWNFLVSVIIWHSGWDFILQPTLPQSNISIFKRIRTLQEHSVTCSSERVTEKIKNGVLPEAVLSVPIMSCMKWVDTIKSKDFLVDDVEIRACQNIGFFMFLQNPVVYHFFIAIAILGHPPFSIKHVIWLVPPVKNRQELIEAAFTTPKPLASSLR